MSRNRNIYYRYKALNAARCKLRKIRDMVGKKDATIIGSYHFNNVGDMALGETLQDIFQTNHLSSRLQTFAGIRKEDRTRINVVGGWRQTELRIF